MEHLKLKCMQEKVKHGTLVKIENSVPRAHNLGRKCYPYLTHVIFNPGTESHA